MRIVQVLCALSTVCSIAAAATHAASQFAGRLKTDQSSLRHEYPDSTTARAAAVREAFQFAWDGYYKLVTQEQAPGRRIWTDGRFKIRIPQ
jgi:hypothetical protein